MLLRFSIFNTVLALAAAFACYFYGAAEALWSVDQTRVTFLIIAIYVGLSAYMGVRGTSSNFLKVRQIGNSLTSIGLVGTVVGIMLLMNSVGASNISDTSQLVGPLFHGFSTLLVTTLFGMASSLLVNYQILFVFGDAPHDEPID